MVNRFTGWPLGVFVRGIESREQYTLRMELDRFMITVTI